MHPITVQDPAATALPQSGENLLIDKTTGRRYPAAPIGSLLLTSAPFGWRGIIVEQHRLPPAEMPEHCVVGHGISVNVGTRPTSFAWTAKPSRAPRREDQSVAVACPADPCGWHRMQRVSP